MNKNLTLSVIMSGMMLVGTSHMFASDHHTKIKELKAEKELLQNEKALLQNENQDLKNKIAKAEKAWGFKSGIAAGVTGTVTVVCVLGYYFFNNKRN